MWLTSEREIVASMPFHPIVRLTIVEYCRGPDGRFDGSEEDWIHDQDVNNEADLMALDGLVRERYRLSTPPGVMATLLMLHKLVGFAEDEGAVPTVSSLPRLAALLGVDVDVVRKMHGVYLSSTEDGVSRYMKYGSTVEEAYEMGRVLGIVS